MKINSRPSQPAEIRGFVIRLLEGARRGGADFAEVYLRSSRNLSVEVKGQRADAVELSSDFGYSLRVIRNSRLGFSYSTDIKEADTVISNAVEASRWTEQDDYLDLPGHSEKQSLDIFDDAVSSLSIDEAKDKALLIEKAALGSDSRIKKVRKASASFSTKDVLIINSKGVDAEYSATTCTAEIMVVAEDGSDSQMGWDSDGSRFLNDAIFEGVGRNAAKRAVELLGAKKIDAVKTQTVLDGSVAAEFLGIFALMLSSENVQKGKSLLAGRMNEAVVSRILNIVDDGCLPQRLGSRPFDDEGVATSKKYLIREGILTGYLYNVYTAKKDGVKSTGNAVKAGFSALPGVGPSNLYITVDPGHVYQGLFEGVDNGIYITGAMGVHTVNPVSGEFSVGISGLWIKNGIIRYPVKEAVMSGNILDLFKYVKAAGDDFRFYGIIGAPSLLTGPVDISA